jgi:hypothetical protein
MYTCYWSRISVPRRFFVVATAIFAIARVSPCEEPAPALDGYVTRAVTASDFDVNGFHILLTGSTRIEQNTANGSSTIAVGDMKLYVGLPIRVLGKIQDKSHSITATKLTLLQGELQKISNAGVIDGVLSSPSPGDHLIRADGYLVLISAATATTFNLPLDLTSAFQVNVWLSFQGTQRRDGVVVADRALFSKNIVTAGEDKLRGKKEYDPRAVAPDAKQNALSKTFRGLNVKMLPPYRDSAMQARVDSIGAALVPRYQRDLPDNDETKIAFRFQVVDLKVADLRKVSDAIALPSGIILVPHQVVERLQNDSQLATVLADNIATVLEKQDIRSQPTTHKIAAESWGGLVVPGLSFASYGTLRDLQRHLEEESGRVSLFLLHDAGYDIYQAPLTWWLLTGSKDISRTPLPGRAKYIYKILGEVWRVN